MPLCSLKPPHTYCGYKQNFLVVIIIKFVSVKYVNLYNLFFIAPFENIYFQLSLNRCGFQSHNIIKI